MASHCLYPEVHLETLDPPLESMHLVCLETSCFVMSIKAKGTNSSFSRQIDTNACEIKCCVNINMSTVDRIVKVEICSM